MDSRRKSEEESLKLWEEEEVRLETLAGFNGEKYGKGFRIQFNLLISK